MAEHKIIVRKPYYATQCEHCGWYGSSENLILHRYHDDADMSCPECHRFVAGDSPKPDLHHRFETWDGEI